MQAHFLPGLELCVMKRYLFAVLVVGGTVSGLTAQGPSLKEARLRWLKGNYEEARSQFDALAKDPKQKPAAVIGLSRVDQSEGNCDKAVALLDAAVKDEPKNA